MTARAKTKSKQRESFEAVVREYQKGLTRRGPQSHEKNGPTPERIRHARRAGGKLNAHLIRDERGLPTQGHRWRITPVLDVLEKRGSISSEEYQAALRYMRHYAGSRHKGPQTAKLMPRYDGGMQDMEPAERAMAMGQARAKAESAVHRLFRPVLRWLEAAAEDELPLWRLGQYYYPDSPRQTQSNRAVPILHFTLAMLSEHYEKDHRFTEQEVTEVLRTIQLSVRMEEKIVKKRKKPS